MKRVIAEDNQATIKIVKKGYSSKMRHVSRHHRVDIGSIHETIDQSDVELTYIESSKQAADIFTKDLPPMKWPAALDLLNIDHAGCESHTGTNADEGTLAGSQLPLAALSPPGDSAVRRSCLQKPSATPTGDAPDH